MPRELVQCLVCDGTGRSLDNQESIFLDVDLTCMYCEGKGTVEIAIAGDDDYGQPKPFGGDEEPTQPGVKVP